MELLYSKQNKTEEYRFKLNRLKIHLNLDQVDKLIRSIYKFVIPYKNNPVQTQTTSKEVEPTNKLKAIYVL